MAVLYYADFSSMNVEELIKKYSDKVDVQRLSKITRTQEPMARVRSLLAGYLLQVAVKEHLGIEDKEQVLDLQYRYGAQGKPYLVDYPQLSFSLSHSGSLVACAVSEQEIGLDVQEYVKVKKGLAERFFTKEECALLHEQTDTKAYEKLFFRLWSIKESYMKLTGLGMKKGLDSFTIDFEENKILEGSDEGKKTVAIFQEIRLEGLPDYAISICARRRKEIPIIDRWNCINCIEDC